MSNWLYIVYFAILAVISVVTGEIVTFIMLGLILLSLNNINTTLKKLLHKQNNEQGTTNQHESKQMREKNDI
ncbi:hypothetical protein JNUCC1_01426 [Lentibacillus sp. JNUCC-1]|uniref:hypothetical protein n=1 Tax=Lentibacillus sp. JNUCC-1 TaxID=2654513 RepID=UPI0012E93591|nr:hypothetical protein [Lentibacillus sp. JNUCC-1]MUV37620.1 hypothetical protein [Lentibacillus sp. JNUCC-1]